MKKFLLTLTMLLTLGLSVQGVAAQVEPGTGLDPEDAEGLTASYMRSYSVDVEAMMSSPSTEGIDMSASMQNVMIQTYTFDSEDRANEYIGTIREEMDSGLTEEMASMGEVEIKDLEAVDKDGFEATISMGDLGMGMTILGFVDGDTIFMVLTMDADVEASTASATDVANFIIDAEVETEEVTFSEDGTSTGGVFDRMPAAGEEPVADLPTVTDTELFNSGE